MCPMRAEKVIVSLCIKLTFLLVEQRGRGIAICNFVVVYGYGPMPKSRGEKGQSASMSATA